MGRGGSEAVTVVMPKPEKSGFIPTLNKQGYMLSSLDEYTQAFVDFAAVSAGPAVDVGAAYGVTTIPALATGAKVIAVDTDVRHLDILRERAPQAFRKNLTTLCAEFPEKLMFEPASAGAFLVARVVHFFTPERLVHAVKKMHEWLIPGGKVFLTGETTYLRNWESFIPVYEERKAAGVPWPGYVENVMRYAPERGKLLPPTMLLLDPDMLRRVFHDAGFAIEKLDFLPRPEFPDDMRYDGRESVGLIARK